MLVVLPPYRVEIALSLLLILFVAGFLVLYSAVRLVSGAVQVPAKVRQYRLARRRDKAQETLLLALESYFEGRYARAEQAAARSIALGEHKRLSAVIAARAAHELRAFDRRDRYLRELAEGAPEENPLRAVTEAELLLDDRRPNDALGVLQALPQKHTAALRLELKRTSRRGNGSLSSAWSASWSGAASSMWSKRGNCELMRSSRICGVRASMRSRSTRHGSGFPSRRSGTAQSRRPLRSLI